MSADDAPIRVLHVDDDPDFGEVVRLQLERVDDDLEVVTETHAQDGLDRLADEPIDCVVSDHEMPDIDGLEFLEAVRERHGDLPFILFTGKGSEEIASRAISAGVTEYLQKGPGSDHYTVLAHRIERAVTQQRARQALEESERMFSTLVENLPGMVYRCRMEPGWPMTYVSEGCKAVTGYTPAEFVSGDVSWGEDVIHPMDRESAWEAVQTAVEAGDSFQFTSRIRTKDGDTRWVWERGSGVTRAGDVYLEGFIADVTDNRERREALEREREFSENVLDTIDDAFYVIDPDTAALVRWNAAVSEYTGYDDEELAGMTVMDLVHEDQVEKIQGAAVEALKTGNVAFETEIIPKDGDPFPVEFRGSPLYDADGELIGIGGIGRDVSERAARERDLERYETITEAVGDPVYTLDAEGTFTFVNEAFEPLTGYTPAELDGRHVSMIITDDDVERGREHIAGLLDDPDRRAIRYEIEVGTKAGATIPCEVHIALLPPDDDGNFRGTAGIVRDISERKRREDRLEAFASVVSHDLQNRLSVIDGRAELALETGDMEHVEAIKRATSKMESMTENLLALSRQGETVGETHSTALDVIAHEAWDGVDTSNGTLTVETSGTIEADPDRLESLFENLFRNAMEHATSQVATEPGSPGDAGGSESTVHVRVVETDKGFAVEDDGPGIPPDERDVVFDRGYTSDEHGTGYGLSIVRRIAEAHGWDVSLTESESGGARFEFST